MRDYKMYETLIDIALNAGYMIATEQIQVNNSRDLVANIINWAKEFEKNYNSNGDYIEEIDKFAEIKLSEEY